MSPTYGDCKEDAKLMKKRKEIDQLRERHEEILKNELHGKFLSYGILIIIIISPWMVENPLSGINGLTTLGMGFLTLVFLCLSMMNRIRAQSVIIDILEKEHEYQEI